MPGAGINRVSLGAQSFDAAALKALGRIHGPGEIPAAVAEVKAAGIGNFNLDLMYGLPGQMLDGALSDVEAAIALGPTHLSHYQLTLEPGTAFHHRPPPLPDDERTFEMQVECQRLLASEGLAQYEVSAYARPGRQCRHNLNYWRFGDYLGIGAGAHGKATVDGNVIRTEKPRSPREYLAGAGKAGAARRAVPAIELPFEFMLNALRLTGGFPAAEFERKTGLDGAVIEPTLARLQGQGLIDRSAGLVRPTELGFRFLNDVQSAFLSDTGDLTRAALRPRQPPAMVQPRGT